jgi:hypothetical protein
MNPTPQDPLGQVLAAWQVRPPPDPAFRPQVWQRLQRDIPATWGGYLRARAGTWLLVAGVTLVAAGWGGRAAAEAKIDAERERRVISYLVELDPRVLALTRP